MGVIQATGFLINNKFVYTVAHAIAIFDEYGNGGIIPTKPLRFIQPNYNHN